MSIYENCTFTVDTKHNDIRYWYIVDKIAYKEIYPYLEARGYGSTKFRITDHPGVISFNVQASLDEGETLVKELAKIYPNYTFSNVFFS